MELQELYSREPKDLLSDHFQYILSIDIGTIYSGYAYANKDEIDLTKGDINIHCSQVWNSGKSNYLSLKTPTCILLDKKQNLVAFGFDAENRYCKIVNDEKQNDFYFFRRFKMVLYEKKITPDLRLTDETGKTLLAKFVFGKSISALKDNFFEMMVKQGILLEAKEIRFVVTVPAIWNDAAKQLMREAANEAGIPNTQLLIALEPEAASVYSQFVKSKDKNDLRLTVSNIGTRYIVADLGGGTVDISVHEKLQNGFLKEIYRSRGDDCGGNSINEALVREMTKNFREPMMNELRLKHPTVYLDVHREFEAAKKTVDGIHNEDMAMRLPFKFLELLIKKKTGDDFLKTIEIGPHGSGVTIKYDTLYIKQSMVRERLFEPTVNKIVDLLKTVISEVDEANESVTKILLVGGFSDSKYIQRSIREAFPDKLVITPESSDLCVVKGAVLFGHSPELISHRVMRFTYGISAVLPFDNTHHDTKYKTEIDGKPYCSKIFSKFVDIGTVVEIDTSITNRFVTIYPFQSSATVSIYVSSKSNPTYVDEPGCRKIGEMEVTFSEPTRNTRPLNISLVFGNTEIQICAKDTVVDRKYSAKLDFVMY